MNEQDWQRLEQEAVLENVRHAFFDSNEQNFSSKDYDQSHPQHIAQDAQTLAAMLQDQLEAINTEIG